MPLPYRLNHFISRFVKGFAITKQIAKVGCESGTLALRQTKNLSACLGGGFFAPLEASNPAQRGQSGGEDKVKD
jgi:hypothetical protein